MTCRREVIRTLGGGALLGMAGCVGGRGETSDEQERRTITDGAGRSVEIPATVERLVAVGPGSLRQIAYLGATDRVVGVEDAEADGWARKTPYNQANPELRERPVIGSAGPNAAGNSEQILAVDPDVIVYYGDPSRADSLQAQTDTPVVVLRIVDFVDEAARETMYETWRLLGTILGKESRAETLADFVRSIISDLEERVTDLPASERRRTYVGAINYKGAHGLATTRKTFPPFQFVGVENVAAGLDTDAASVQVSEEQLLAWDPPTVFVSAANLERVREDLRSTAAFAQLEAVANGAVYAILPHASYHHNYGSILCNAYFVGRTNYPERFDDVSLAAKADAIFDALLGTALFDPLTETYDAFEPLEV
jgi:iron complex transport system substrate-binding protein